MTAFIPSVREEIEQSTASDLSEIRARNRMAEFKAGKSDLSGDSHVLMKDGVAARVNPALIAFLKSFAPQIGCPFSHLEVRAPNTIDAYYDRAPGVRVKFTLSTDNAAIPIPFEAAEQTSEHFALTAELIPRYVMGQDEPIGYVSKHGGGEPHDPSFAMDVAINELANFIHARNVKAGWWTDLKTGADLHGKRNIGELLCLVHSELSEAADGANAIEQVLFSLRHEIDSVWAGEEARHDRLQKVHNSISRAMEGHRKGMADDKIPGRPMFRVELIDALIRILDILGSDNKEHPAGEIFVEKVDFNHSRADHKPENRVKAGGKVY